MYTCMVQAHYGHLGVCICGLEISGHDTCFVYRIQMYVQVQDGSFDVCHLWTRGE